MKETTKKEVKTKVAGQRVNGYYLANHVKYEAARKAAGDNLDLILPEYDKRGGLILKDGEKLATGCFYDFEKRKPKEAVVLKPAKETSKGGTVVVNVVDKSEKKSSKKK